ncbi:hypothetical protein VPNG_10365 [Cytospora leucostoma]|uniref:Uncharacterized protein n=1 Tax=Cytospora leucostoma TaxID=1230097 RepID=A0A423VAL3_9PEZI|nr:hypothetical protein VPNG_10365 [Cytospora leucostoma]
MGFAPLVGGMASQLLKLGSKHWENTTSATNTASSYHQVSNASTTTTSEATIYTNPANWTIKVPRIALCSLEAICGETMYSFEFAMYCNASVPAVDGNLGEFKVAKCWQPDECYI